VIEANKNIYGEKSAKQRREKRKIKTKSPATSKRCRKLK
jgi:hypothetical protein